MATLRVTVSGSGDDLEAIKKQFYKALYSSAGDNVVFEVPDGDDEGAATIMDAAKELGMESKKDTHEDPLDAAEPVGFFD